MMYKVGNIHSWLIAFSMVCMASVTLQAQTKIRLKAVDEDGIELKQVAVNAPWYLELVIEGTRSTSHTPTIAGLEGFEVHKQGVQMNMINGVATIKYMYRVVIPHVGTYHVGPAQIIEQDKPIRSATTMIKVSDQVIQDPRAVEARKKHISAKKVILQTSVEKNRVVVGEPTRFFVRFLYRTKDISLQGIQVPECKDFFLGQKIGPLGGKQMIDGIEYNYLEWHWDFIAKKNGAQKIPMFSAEFLEQPDENSFGGLAALFRGFADKKKIYSNILDIMVEELPPHDPPVQLVGDFSSLRASVDHPVVREGDAVVLVLEVEGTGNLSLVDSIQLQGIPEGFKAHPSKVYMSETTGKEPYKKYFEYILQAIKRGSWEIPAQKIIYFDTVSRTYKGLHSEKISMNILLNTSRKQVAESSGIDQNGPQEISSALLSEKQESMQDGLAPLATCFVSYVPTNYGMPWWLFLLCTVLPCGVLVYPIIKKTLQETAKKFIARYNPLWYRRAIFSKARSELKRAQYHKDLKKIYEIFLRLYADCLGISYHTVTEQKMHELFISLGFSSAEYLSWQEFFARIEQEIFAPHKHDGKDHSTLFAVAYGWLDTLEARM